MFAILIQVPGGDPLNVPETQLAQWRTEYPGVDFEAEAAKSARWLKARPDHPPWRSIVEWERRWLVRARASNDNGQANAKAERSHWKFKRELARAVDACERLFDSWWCPMGDRPALDGTFAVDVRAIANAAAAAASEDLKNRELSAHRIRRDVTAAMYEWCVRGVAYALDPTGALINPESSIPSLGERGRGPGRIRHRGFPIGRGPDLRTYQPEEE